MNGSMVKLVMDKETTVVIVDFGMDVFKLMAEVGGYLQLWLGLLCDATSSIRPQFRVLLGISPIQSV